MLTLAAAAVEARRGAQPGDSALLRAHCSIRNTSSNLFRYVAYTAGCVVYTCEIPPACCRLGV